MDLYEKTLGTDFSRTDLGYFKNKLPELLVNNLEILDDIEINEAEAGLFIVKMKGEVHMSLCSQHGFHPNTHYYLGCPICSSIACALARVTDKGVIIEKNEASTREKTTTTWYRLVEDK